MSNHQSLLIDPTKLQDVQQALPCLPALNSYNVNDEGILLLHYKRYPAHELPAYAAKYHIVPIWGLDSQAKIEARLDDRDYRGMFGRGASGVIPAQFEHWAVWDQAIDLTVVFLHPKLIEQVAEQNVKGGRIELMPKHDTYDPALTQLGLLLKADLEAGYPSGKLYRDSIVTALAARLVNHHATCPICPESSVAGLSNARLQIIMNYIQDYLEQEIKLADLARLIDLSESYLCRAFKKSTGISLHQYLLQQRIERAKRLLKHSHLNLTEIAQHCGFSSHSHFTLQFKRFVGVLPSQMRLRQ